MRNEKSIHSVDVLGVRIDDVTMDELIGMMKEMAASGRGHHVATVNPEFVMLARRDAAFAGVLRACDLAVPDGIGIVLASWILGRGVRQRITGVDSVRAVANMASREGFSLFLLGAAPGVAEEAAKKLSEECPGLKIAGTFAGSPSAQDEDDICRRIEAVRPHFLFVAYGPPKQDFWIARTAARLNVPVAMGVGGTFDFITGRSVRAPRWVQRLGLEWFHRLIKEPWRWRRMLSLPKFAWAVLVRRLAVIRGR